MEKYKRNKKALYICFVDFRKAFDTVWHSGLFYKMLSLGISSKFFAVIKSLYNNVMVTVQCKDKITPFFRSEVGVRQGDNLSPSLFNLFINDLPALFSDCSPPQFGDMDLSCLLYADDLVISETVEGMQKALNNLGSDCNTWRLSVNTEKTKLVCVNEPPKPDNLLYQNQHLRVCKLVHLFRH